ncbi:MAG TPA: sugar ABC transporter permease [Mycobacteriales bacterium]|nr:sugar ABC transporter permease [Mycobacteriales bacterium]
MSAVGLRRRRALTAWAFMLPLLGINALVVIGPGIASLYYSFTDWSGIGGAKWIGLANYRRLLTDDDFLNALKHNLWWTAFFLIIPMAMGLFGAFLLSRMRRFQLLFRVVYFIPYVVATVVSASIWRNLLAPDQGITALFSKLGLHWFDDVNFLGDPQLALGSVAVVNTWQWWGFLLVVFLAAMQGVDPTLYEAARIDGAGAWRQFTNVTLPAIRPTLMFLALMTIVWSFLIFDYVYIMTQGGPAGATDVLGTLMYRSAFEENEAGYAAAVGIVLALISFVVAAGYQFLRRRRDWEI